MSIENLATWRQRILWRLDQEQRRDPEPALQALLAELRSYPGSPTTAPPAGEGDPAGDDVGFAVPLRLSSGHGPLRFVTTMTTFTGACDITMAELKLEAFLPADEATATILYQLDASPTRMRMRSTDAGVSPGSGRRG